MRFCPYVYCTYSILLLTIVAAQKKDYCQFKCKDIPNIACNHTEKPDAKCVNFKKLEFTPAHVKIALDEHNNKRSTVALGKALGKAGVGLPTAKNMNELIWDDELAYLSYLNILACRMQHDKCRDTETQNGQNLFSAFTTANYTMDEVIKNGVKAWFSEVKDVKLSDIANFTGSLAAGPAASTKSTISVGPNKGKKTGSKAKIPAKAPQKSTTKVIMKDGVKTIITTLPSGPVVPHTIGHFTQLVWANSTKVGCAMCSYTEGKFNAFLMACDYCFGNVLRHSVYDSGPIGADCKNKTPNGLCSSSETLVEAE